MSVVRVNGLNLNVQQLGSGDRCLVMLHGLLVGNLASWYLTAGGLAGEARRVILFDLRGHGASEMPAEGYGTSTMAGDLSALLDSVAPGVQVDLAGFSYGSLVALRFTLAHPDKVRRLALVETPLPPLAPLVERYRNADLEVLLREIPAATRKALMASPRRVLSATRRVRALIDGTSLLEDVCTEPVLDEAALGALRVPVLCVHGSQSQFLNDGRWLAARLPDSRLEVLAGSHQLLSDNGPGTMAAIREFFDG